MAAPCMVTERRAGKVEAEENDLHCLNLRERGAQRGHREELLSLPKSKPVTRTAQQEVLIRADDFKATVLLTEPTHCFGTSYK